MQQQERPRWRPTRRQVLWTLAIVAGVTVAVLIGYRYGITLWDWIKLLIVPAVIAAGGLWFNAQQREREQQIATQHAQDDALQAYLDKMADMLIPSSKDLPSLYKARPGESLSSVARARTLTVLRRLNGDRKARVVQFLYESGLISRERPVLELDKADLSEAQLGGADLRTADLSGANLHEANLHGVDLREANLHTADFHGCNLGEGVLRRADLSEADLRGANLSGAHLGYFLRLSGADLSGANLFAGGPTPLGEQGEQALKEAKSLEGATMPNGQTYEDWLKSRDENGKNSGTS